MRTVNGPSLSFSTGKFHCQKPQSSKQRVIGMSNASFLRSMVPPPKRPHLGRETENGRGIVVAVKRAL